MSFGAENKGDLNAFCQKEQHSQHCPRWTRRKDARPDEIIDAALDMFIEKGFAATRLDDVAKKAGVSKGTLYLYFKDKEDLFRRVVETGILSRVNDLEEVVKTHEGQIEDLVKSIVKQMTYQVTQTRMGAMPKLMISEIGNFPSLGAFYRDEVVFKLHRIIGIVIELGIQQGKFRNVSVMEAARDLLAPIFLMAIATHMPGFNEHLMIDAEKQAEVTADLWLKGMMKDE